MAKKKKKKNINNIYRISIDRSKKEISHDYDDILDEIESSRIKLYEADKRRNRKQRKKINKKEKEFYTDMESIKCRKKMAKKWQKNGFLDTVIHILKSISPLVKMIAKLIASLITAFLSLDCIRSHISTSMLNKITKVFNIAMAV
jgi:hypothetical protein